jgi:hypothetical protein
VIRKILDIKNKYYIQIEDGYGHIGLIVRNKALIKDLTLCQRIGRIIRGEGLKVSFTGDGTWTLIPKRAFGIQKNGDFQVFEKDFVIIDSSFLASN